MATALTDARDYFTDLSLLKDPYAFFDAAREDSPVAQMPDRNAVLVTGFAEAVEVLLNTTDFSSAGVVGGPVAPMPFVPEGDDISAEIDARRAEFYGGDIMISKDGAQHAATRSLLSRLFTPSRLKSNEAYMHGIADDMVDDAVRKGGCEMISTIASPFVTLVIADLLGVPADDREKFRAVIDAAPPPGNMEADSSFSPLEYMAGFFVRYIEERRAQPREDVLSEFAHAKMPDGSTPDVMTLVGLASFLFAAGQDTSAKLLSNSVRFLSEMPEMQARLRADLSQVPAFIEEVLRLQGSTKTTFRLARRTTTIGGVEVKAGTWVVVALAGANRDPRRWDDPAAFVVGRERIREHLAFGRGAHVCVGAPLARVEVRVLLERLLSKTSSIGLSEAHHGTPGQFRLDYEPSFIIRGLSELHVVLTPA